MFFPRLKTNSLSTKGSVAVIGSSPLAFLLADIAQTNNFSATIIVSNKELQQNRLPNSLTIQTLPMQTHQARFNFSDRLIPADYYLIASNPETAKTDLLLLSKDFLKDATVANFSPFYNKDILQKSDFDSVITCYFNSWLILEKNSLKLLERKAEVKIQAPVEKSNKLLPLFENSVLNIGSLASNKKYFWHHLIPYFLSNLMLLNKPNKDLSSLLQQQDYREQITAAAKELCDIAKKHKEVVSETDVFSVLYSIPSDYKTSVSCAKAFAALISLVPEINKFETPSLYKLLTSALNKY